MLCYRGEIICLMNSGVFRLFEDQASHSLAWPLRIFEPWLVGTRMIPRLVQATASALSPLHAYVFFFPASGKLPDMWKLISWRLDWGLQVYMASCATQLFPLWYSAPAPVYLHLLSFSFLYWSLVTTQFQGLAHLLPLDCPSQIHDVWMSFFLNACLFGFCCVKPGSEFTHCPILTSWTGYCWQNRLLRVSPVSKTIFISNLDFLAWQPTFTHTVTLVQEESVQLILCKTHFPPGLHFIISLLSFFSISFHVVFYLPKAFLSIFFLPCFVVRARYPVQKISCFGLRIPLCS